MILFTYRYYAKRCFLSLIENLGKHMITVKDSVIQECIQFLEHCEGKDFSTIGTTHFFFHDQPHGVCEMVHDTQ